MGAEGRRTGETDLRAIVMHRTGPPEVLGVENVPQPTPGPREMLVLTEAAGVNFAETRSRAGAFLPMVPASLPARIGVEAVGTVIAAGDDIDAAWLGRRVLAVTGNGTYAEYFTVAAHGATVVPDDVSPIEAVAVGIQASVALALLDVAGPLDSNVVLVEAAGGGVGGYLLQLVRELGAARVIATAGNKAKRDHALASGADAAIDHRDPNWTDHVRDVVNGSTLDVVFESLGGASARRLLDIMTNGSGRMVYYGQLAGPAEVTPTDLMLRALTLIGCGSRPGDYHAGQPSTTGWLARLGEARATVLDRLSNGQIRALIDCVLPLPEAADAHRRIETREAIGKIILVP